MTRLGLCVLGGRAQRSSAALLTYCARDAVNVACRCRPQSPDWGSGSVSAVKLLFPPRFPSSSLWREVTARSPHPGSGDYSLSPGQSIQMNYLESYCVGGLSLFHTYIFISVRTVHICFVFRAKTQCRYTLLVRLLQLWPLGARSGSSCIPAACPSWCVCEHFLTTWPGKRVAVESAISLGSPCSFEWRTALETKI